MRQALMAALGIALTGTLAFAQMDKKMPPTSKVADALMAKERALIDAVKARDAKVFSSMVKPGSWSVDENGTMAVDDLIKMLGDPKADIKIEMLKASDMRVIDIDTTSAIVSYKTEQRGSFMGQPMPPVTYVTTIWASHGGTWHAIFHQESTARK